MPTYERFTINKVPVRVTTEGCDWLKLSVPPHHDILQNLPMASNVAFVRCQLQGKERLYYVNKRDHQLIEITIDDTKLQQLDTKVASATLELNQPHPLSTEQLSDIEKLTGFASPISKKVRDIEFSLTPQERFHLQRRLYDNRSTPKNSAYTYIFQNYLAKYQGQMQHELAKLQDEKTRLTSAGKSTAHITAEIEHFKTTQGWMEQMRRISAQFIEFEKLINNPGQKDPQIVLQGLLDLLADYEAAINRLTANQDYAQYPAIKGLLTALPTNIAPSLTQFKAQLTAMIEQGVSRAELARLLCVQTRDSQIKSLGTFMAEQMTTILECGIKVAYELSDNRLGDLLSVPESVSALSDAKKNIELKAFSLDGAEYNETYQPITEEMLSALTPEHEPTATAEAKPQWFSINPYLHKFNPQDIDKITCLVTLAHFENKKSAMMYYRLGKRAQFIAEAGTVIGIGFVKLLASLGELALYVPLRFAALIILTTIDAIGALINTVVSSVASVLGRIPGLGFFNALINTTWLKPRAENKMTNWVDQQLSQIHARNSIVKWSKRWSNQRYQRMDAHGKPINDDHQKLVEKCMDDPNFFQEAFVYFNPERVSGYIKHFASSIGDSIGKFFRDPLYLFSSRGYDATPEEVYTITQIRQQFINKYQQKRIAEYEKREQTYQAALPADADIKGPQYNRLKHCAINEIESPLEVFREIMLTLDDTVIDPMFRKSPGAATFYFMVSMTTFGTYLAPTAAIAWMKSLPAWLQIPTDIISVHFTGKATSLGMMEQMVACFLEWKLGFFSTELLMEMQRGNFEFFNEMVKEPEQVTLGLVGLIGMGMAMQYLPLLPTTIPLPVVPGMLPMPPIYNFYAEVYNVFIDEAKGCAEGTPGLTGIEYGFLGLKFGMLLHSMLAGTHAHERHDALQALAKACAPIDEKGEIDAMIKPEDKFIVKIMRACQKVDLFSKSQTEIETQFAVILSQTLDEILKKKNLTTQFTAEDIQAFKAILAEQISPKEIENYLALKNPKTRASAQNKLKGNDPEARFKRLTNYTIHLVNDLPADKTAYHNSYCWNQQTKQLSYILEDGTIKEHPLYHPERFEVELAKYKDQLDQIKLSVTETQLGGLLRETALAKAYRELQEAIALASDKNNPLVFDKDPLKEANKYYDHLDALFNRYNHELQKAGRADLCVDKRSYLDVFYNKYCYRGSNNLLRTLLFFPVPIPVPPFYFPGVYLTVALFRGLKYTIARWRNKPSIAHQVVKSFNKDFVLLCQMVAVVLRTTQVMARAISYSLRPFVAVAALVLSALPWMFYRGAGALGLVNVMSRKAWFKQVDAFACSMVALHRPRTWYLLGQGVGYLLWPAAAASLTILTVLPYGAYRLAGAGGLVAKQDIISMPVWGQQLSQAAWGLATIFMQPLRLLRISYAQAARVAGTSHDINQAGEQMKQALAEATADENKNLFGKSALGERAIPYVATHSKVGQLLEKHDRTLQRTKIATKAPSVMQSSTPKSPPVQLKKAEHYALEMQSMFNSKAHAVKKAIATPMPKIPRH